MRALFLLIALSLLSIPANAIDVTSCQAIDSPGYYTLANDITDTSTSICFWIRANNVTIDGNGHAISGSPSGNGILIGSNLVKAINVTIKNISITGWYAGISVKHAENVEILNVVVEDNSDGISLGDPQKTSGLIKIDNCTIRNNTEDGINVGYNVNGVVISNSTITGNYYGIDYGQTNVYNPDLTVYNNIFNNTQNVYSQVDFNAEWNTTKKPGVNIVGGSYLGGNAWLSPDGYGFSQTCVDSDSDGICDDPYQINSKSTDFLPLAVQGQTPPPIQEYRISGKIFYSGTERGVIFIEVLYSCDFPSPIYFENISSPGNYSINVTGGSYYIRAYMDVNGNFTVDESEPHGFAINKTNCSDADVINVTSDLSGIDITLFERQDTTPPAITFVNPTPANNSILSQNYVFVNITSSEPLSSALLNWNGANLTMQGSDRNWHYNVTGLADGTYHFRVYGRDLAGNWNVTETRVVTVSIPHVEDNYVLRILIVPNSDNQKEDAFSIDLSIIPKESIVVEEGDYRIYLTSNKPVHAPIPRLKDEIPPAIVFVDPTPLNNSVLGQNYVFVNITSNEPLSNALLNWNGINLTMQGSDRNWYYNVTGLSNGIYRFKVYGADLTGNWNATETRVVNISLPQLTDSYVLRIYIAITPSKIQSDAYDLDLSVTPRKGVAIIEGDYVLRLSLNKIVYSLAKHAEQDTTPPAITFVNPTPANNSILSQNYVFVNITSSEPLSSALLNWNGANLTMQGSDRNWHYNVTGLADGTYHFRVYGRDLAGNWNVTETRVVTVSIPEVVRDEYLLEISIITGENVEKSDVFNLSLSLESNLAITIEETGYEIRISAQGVKLGASKSQHIAARGDFNGNGEVDIGDVVYVAHIVIGRISQDPSADFNGNGRVDIGDLAKIAYYLLGEISEL